MARAESKSSRPRSSESASTPDALHPRQVGLAELGGHAALALPEAPGDRGRCPAFRLALLGEGVEEDVGGRVVGLACACQGCPPPRRRGRRRRDLSPRSARAGSRRLSALAVKTCSTCSAVRVSIVPSAIAPAQWMTAPSGCSLGTRARSFFSALRSDDVAGGDRRLGAELFELAFSSSAPSASGPLRLTRSRWRAPWCSARWRAVSAPRPPVAPVSRTVRSGSIAGVASSPSSASSAFTRVRRAARALPSRRASWGSSAPIAERGVQCLLGCLCAVAVDQGEAAGVLGLGRADEAPDRRRRRGRVTPPWLWPSHPR